MGKLENIFGDILSNNDDRYNEMTGTLEQMCAQEAKNIAIEFVKYMTMYGELTTDYDDNLRIFVDAEGEHFPHKIDMDKEFEKFINKFYNTL